MQGFAQRFRKAAWQGSLIIFLGLILSLGVNALRHDGLPVIVQGKQSVTVVSVDDAWKLFQQGKVVFLDAREVENYQSAHLPEAVSVPVESAKVKEAEVRRLAEGGRKLVAYCDGQGCGKARDLAEALAADKVPGVVVMPDGWQGWMQAGLPVDEGGQ